MLLLDQGTRNVRKGSHKQSVVSLPEYCSVDWHWAFHCTKLALSWVINGHPPVPNMRRALPIQIDLRSTAGCCPPQQAEKNHFKQNLSWKVREILIHCTACIPFLCWNMYQVHTLNRFDTQSLWSPWMFPSKIGGSRAPTAFQENCSSELVPLPLSLTSYLYHSS